MVALPNPRGFTSDRALHNWVKEFCASRESVIKPELGAKVLTEGGTPGYMEKWQGYGLLAGLTRPAYEKTALYMEAVALSMNHRLATGEAPYSPGESRFYQVALVVVRYLNQMLTPENVWEIMAAVEAFCLIPVPESPDPRIDAEAEAIVGFIDHLITLYSSQHEVDTNPTN